MKLGSLEAWQQGCLPTQPSLQPLPILFSFSLNVVYQGVVLAAECLPNKQEHKVRCVQPQSLRQRCTVTAAQVAQDRPPHTLSLGSVFFPKMALHRSVIFHCLTLAALLRDSLLKRSVYPCVCMCTHVCVPREESPLVLLV